MGGAGSVPGPGNGPSKRKEPSVSFLWLRGEVVIWQNPINRIKVHFTQRVRAEVLSSGEARSVLHFRRISRAARSPAEEPEPLNSRLERKQGDGSKA